MAAVSSLDRSARSLNGSPKQATFGAVVAAGLRCCPGAFCATAVPVVLARINQNQRH